MRSGMCLTDARGRLKSATPSARRILGIRAAAGQKVCDILCAKIGNTACPLKGEGLARAVTASGKLGPEESFDWKDCRVVRVKRFRSVTVRCMRRFGGHVVLLEEDIC